VDHKHTNGKEEREVRDRETMFRMILKDPLYAKGFQILCVNCHKRKRYTEDVRNNKLKPQRLKKQLDKVIDILKPLVFKK